MTRRAIQPTITGRRKPLACCVATLFALAAPPSLATTWTVNSCAEGNSGSGTTGTLRYAAANALNNDTIDLSGLTCSTISLQTGAIVFNQSSIHVTGPGQTHLTITGKYNSQVEKDRIFTHTGTGILQVENLSVGKGYRYVASGNARGGCIYSAGSVYLKNVGVYSCNAYAKAGGRAQGGGVYGKNAVTLKYSTVAGNFATTGGLNGGYGGGVYAVNSFYAKYSTISGNTAGKAVGFGGGALVYGSGVVFASTISGNSAKTNGGGIYAHNFFSSGNNTLTLRNSTLSGNQAGVYGGGLVVNAGKVYLENSTIVFNTANKGRYGTLYPFTYRAPGVATDDTNGAMAVTLQSTLIANNTYGNNATEYDLSVPHRANTQVTFSGANNLVRATFAAVPSGTLKLSCPILGSLRANGGLTQTHALLSKSPGIDQGNNSTILNYDQRGAGYPRVSGAAADIGAYEVQQSDIVFNNNFETCPLLL
jgi:hypothetical protein